MTFALEAVKARKGDCLLLHYEKGGNQALGLIDGGPSKVYHPFLRPRLEELRAQQNLDDGDALFFDLLMLSHIDDDHINGLLQMMSELITAKDDNQPLRYDFGNVWFNSFDDIVGNNSVAMLQAASASIDVAGLAASGRFSSGLTHRASLVAASVNQGRELRDAINALQFPMNEPWRTPLFSVHDRTQDTFELSPGLDLLVVGPSKSRVEDLQEKWDEEVRKKQQAGATPSSLEAAAYLDRSVANLSSLVVLAESDGKSMLLTGDARGDDILEAAEALDLFDAQGVFHVDLLKLPHHGSDNNVETDFFRRITADHYVVSGDGTHHNPEVSVVEMIKTARGGDDFTLWMTYRPEEFRHPYDDAGRQALVDALDGVDVRFPEAGANSVTVEL